MATQAQIAEHLDRAERRVRDLMAEGVLNKGADLDQCRISYIRHLRGGASGKSTGAGLKLTDERARLAKLKADKVEIELAELRGEMIKAEDASGSCRDNSPLAVVT
jgi:phage terminase Nu1 subunit (DNA packaging protein)